MKEYVLEISIKELKPARDSGGRFASGKNYGRFKAFVPQWVGYKVLGWAIELVSKFGKVVTN